MVKAFGSRPREVLAPEGAFGSRPREDLAPEGAPVEGAAPRDPLAVLAGAPLLPAWAATANDAPVPAGAPRSAPLSATDIPLLHSAEAPPGPLPRMDLPHSSRALAMPATGQTCDIVPTMLRNYGLQTAGPYRYCTNAIGTNYANNSHLGARMSGGPGYRFFATLSYYHTEAGFDMFSFFTLTSSTTSLSWGFTCTSFTPAGGTWAFVSTPGMSGGPDSPNSVHNGYWGGFLGFCFYSDFSVRSDGVKWTFTREACPTGHYCPTDGFATIPCAAGTFNPNTANTSSAACLSCAVGAYSASGASSCAFTATTCPVGTYAAAPASCAACSPATACTVPGLTAQPPCYWNVSTLAGSGAAGWADGQGSTAAFREPTGVSFDPALLRLYVGDYGGNRVRRISPSGTVSTVAGSGSAGLANGVGTAASFFRPVTAQVDSLGTLHVADFSNHVIRIILPSGAVTTFAGSIAGGANGVGTSAQFLGPTDIAFDKIGTTCYIVEQLGHRIRSIALSTAAVATLAGSGVAGFADGAGAAAQFNWPTSAVWHPSGVVFVADWQNNRIRRIVTASSAVTTLSGNGAAGGSNGVGTTATFSSPLGVAFDSLYSILYVAEQGGNRIRSIDLSTALVKTVAGSGAAGFGNSFGVTAVFNGPVFIASAPSGVLYTAESLNHRIRQLTCVPCPAGFSCSTGAPVPCPAGSFCPLSSLSPAPCPAGTWSGPWATACTRCSAGTFSAFAGATSPSTCAPCAAGSFSGSPGSSVCQPCAAGFYSPAAGAAGCLPCSAGTFNPATGQPSPCTAPCPPGYICPANSSLPAPCPASTANPGFGGASSADCAPCDASLTSAPGSPQCSLAGGASSCYAGSSRTSDPDTNVTSCFPCAAGTFSSVTDAPSCRPCAAGTFSGPGATSCTICPAGSFCSGGGPTACPAGRFGAARGERSLAGCAQCAVGTYNPSDGSASSAACFACPPGAFSSAAGAASCELCPAGTSSLFSGATDNATCAPCGAGTFSGAAGQAICGRSCPKGTYGVREGGVSAAQACASCAPGRFSDAAGATECPPCPSGTFAEGEGAAACAPCPPGRASAAIGAANASTCAACEVGLFNGYEGQSFCSAQCPRGRYGAAAGGVDAASACAPCAAGTFAAAPASAACTPCRQGVETPPTQ